MLASGASIAGYSPRRQFELYGAVDGAVEDVRALPPDAAPEDVLARCARAGCWRGLALRRAGRAAPQNPEIPPPNADNATKELALMWLYARAAAALEEQDGPGTDDVPELLGFDDAARAEYDAAFGPLLPAFAAHNSVFYYVDAARISTEHVYEWVRGMCCAWACSVSKTDLIFLRTLLDMLVGLGLFNAYEDFDDDLKRLVFRDSARFECLLRSGLVHEQEVVLDWARDEVAAGRLAVQGDALEVLGDHDDREFDRRCVDLLEEILDRRLYRKVLLEP
jgi:hypothetical protein